MNGERRKKICRLIDRAEGLKEALENVMNEEQESYDALPEGLQETELGCRLYENVIKMDNSLVYLDDIIEALYELREK